MLSSGALTDVTISAGGTSVKAHRLVLASCSQYFAQLFKEVESETNTLVVVLNCDPSELKLLLTFMYTGEVTASKKILPSLLRLAQTLKVSGLTDANTNSVARPSNSEVFQCDDHETKDRNLELNVTDRADVLNVSLENDNETGNQHTLNENVLPNNISKEFESTPSSLNDFISKKDKERLSKLDQIVRNLYSSHRIENPTVSRPATLNVLPNLEEPTDDRKWRMTSSVCSICNKRLSNQYNLRVHMETHAGRRHACLACSHVSRSRDALRKHVAYRHATLGRDVRGDL